MWAIENELPSSELVAMLRPLVAHTQGHEVRGRLVRLELAERLLLTPKAPSHAWEVAGLARQVLRHESDGITRARANGALGMAMTLLGQYRMARRAYFKALADDPGHPVLLHNLGHLMATVFKDPLGGCRWLRLAYRSLPDDREVAASYAHALTLAGLTERALDVLSRTESRERARRLIATWRERPSF